MYRPDTCRTPSRCKRWYPKHTSDSRQHSKERIPKDLFGICIVGTSGNIYMAGDAEYEFTIMSVSKPFVFALVCAEVGVAEVRERIGVNATGLAFNSLTAVEQNPEGKT